MIGYSTSEVGSRQFAAAIEQARASGAPVADKAKQHGRTGAELESLKMKPAGHAGSIVRRAIGEVRRGDGVSEYGRRIDITLAAVLEVNPGQLMRSAGHPPAAWAVRREQRNQ